MADYLTTDTELTSIANAIRTKGGTSANLTYPTGFVNAINAIPTGGGSGWQDVSDHFTYWGGPYNEDLADLELTALKNGDTVILLIIVTATVDHMLSGVIAPDDGYGPGWEFTSDYFSLPIFAHEYTYGYMQIDNVPYYDDYFDLHDVATPFDVGEGDWPLFICGAYDTYV